MNLILYLMILKIVMLLEHILMNFLIIIGWCIAYDIDINEIPLIYNELRTSLEDFPDRRFK